ncbi:sugar phosphate isomerase/epimerase family protein [Zunongwangia endophytica]|uniref:Sugar phosphate isomerase/epimerase family protein n=1 Tax=Zunongwangia endophytica TaxID=1808945 RepID=A0ABV8H3Y8_9FLAO|nr:sugar phosphate isomerase/epimerase family protein [Zunongwangia endophytica]MDN3594570.1 sugar phosphate isomerase/epimerase family protein [Zunongwangia endophytica]
MNKIGVCSWILGIEDPHEMMEKVKLLGLDGIQFSGDWRNYDAKEISAAADHFQIEIFAIDPYNCAPPILENANKSSAIEFYQKIINFAVEANVAAVNLQGLPQWTINCSNREECWEMLVDCCKTLDAYAQLKKVKLVYECVNRYESSMIHTVTQGLNLINAVGHTNFSLILDSFHMHIEETDPIEAIRDAADFMYSYQISDSNRSGIGRGQVDFVKHHAILDELDFEGPIMIEVVLPELVPNDTPKDAAQRERLDEEIRRSVRVWRNLKDSENY